MDPHAWPSLYPAIIVGVLLGIAHGGFMNIALGGVGALVAAVATFGLIHELRLEEGLLTLAIMVIASLAGAKAAMVLFGFVRRRLSS
jgi:hypothetical protein